MSDALERRPHFVQYEREDGTWTEIGRLFDSADSARGWALANLPDDVNVAIVPDAEPSEIDRLADYSS